MNYLNYSKADVVNGYGMRVCIWLPYCTHACKNCFNKSSWFGGGQTLTKDFEDSMIKDLSKPYISGITFSGGDPLDLHNIKWVLSMCKRIRLELPEKNIMIYSGYTYEQVLVDDRRKEILLWCDQFMDGKYECDKPTTKPFRGSDNQILHTISNGISVAQN